MALPPLPSGAVLADQPQVPPPEPTKTKLPPLPAGATAVPAAPAAPVAKADTGPIINIPPPSQQKDTLLDTSTAIVQDMTGTMDASWEQLKNDAMTAWGTDENSYANKGFWDLAKVTWKKQVAAGMIPVDAFNLVMSIPAGIMRGTAVKAAAHTVLAARDFFNLGLPEGTPITKYNLFTGQTTTDKYHRYTQQEMEDAVNTGIMFALPEESAPLLAGEGLAELGKLAEGAHTPLDIRGPGRAETVARPERESMIEKAQRENREIDAAKAAKAGPLTAKKPTTFDLRGRAALEPETGPADLRGGTQPAPKKGTVAEAKRRLAAPFQADEPGTIFERGYAARLVNPADEDSTFAHLLQRPFYKPGERRPWRNKDQEWASRKVGKAFQHDEVTRERALEEIERKGKTISDLGEEAVTSATETAALSGEGRRLGMKLVKQRLSGRVGRIVGGVQNYISNRSFYNTMKNFMRSRWATAKAFFDEAFDFGGGTQALITQFEGHVADTSSRLTEARQARAAADDAVEASKTMAHPVHEESLNTASKNLRAAQDAVSDAERNYQFATQKSSGADPMNVYGSAARQQAIREAESALEAAQGKLDDATMAHENAQRRLNMARESATKGAEAERVAAHERLTLSEKEHEAAWARLRTAQQHQRLNVKGGIWSPLIERLLNNENVQKGIHRGIQIEKNLADARNKPLNIKEWALAEEPKGDFDMRNPPRVQQVPTLKLMHSAVEGLDDSLEDSRDKLTGKIHLNKFTESIMELRRSLSDELKRLTRESNPAYARALEIWSGQSRLLDAMYKGLRGFYEIGSEELKDYLHGEAHPETGKRQGGLSADEREAYRIGVTKAITKNAQKGPAQALRESKNIVENEEMQKKMRLAIGDPKAADEFIRMAQDEVDMAQRAGPQFFGPRTAGRLVGEQELRRVDEGLADGAVNAVRTGLMSWLNPHYMGMRFGVSYLDSLLSEMQDSRRTAMAHLLFSTNKEDNIKAINMIFDEIEAGEAVPQMHPGIRKRKAIIPGFAAIGSNVAPTAEGNEQQDSEILEQQRARLREQLQGME